MRRTLIITAAVILVIGLGVAAYFVFLSKKPAVSVAPGGSGFPSAGNASTSLPSTGSLASSTQPAPPSKVSARLVKITQGPVVSGEIALDVGSTTATSDASSTAQVVVDYIERQSGNIFTYNVHTGVATRISNTTIPGIESAVWLPDASKAIVRYLSGNDNATVNTYLLPSDGSNGSFLPQDLAGVDASSAGILELASGVNGSSVSIGDDTGSNLAQAFSTPLSAVRAMFAGKQQYLVVTKANSSLPGDAYLVSGGVFSRVAGPENGLTALSSPDGKWVLANYTDGTNVHLVLVNAKTGEQTPLPIATLTDKCAWTADSTAIYCGVPQQIPSGAYPDDWYQGKVHFSDRIWKIDVSGRFAQMVLDFPKETSDTLDAESLTLDPAGTVLVFKNRNDGSLWSYTL